MATNGSTNSNTGEEGSASPDAPKESIRGFNTFGFGLKVPGAYAKPIVVHILRLSQTSLSMNDLEKHVRVPLNVKDINTESDEDEFKPALCIGFTCKESEAYTSTGRPKKKGNKKQKLSAAAATAVPNEPNDREPIDPDKAPLVKDPTWIAPVVMKCEPPGAQISFYVLSEWKQETRQCVGHLISSSQVFFLPALVDLSIPQRAERKRMWKAGLAKYLEEHFGQTKKKVWPRKFDEAPVAFDFERSFANEVSSLFGIYEEGNGDTAALHAIQRRIEQAYPHLTMTAYLNRNLHGLIHVHKPLTKKIVKGALGEFKKLWPEALDDPVTSRGLRRLGEGLREVKAYVPFDHVRPLVVLWTKLSNRDINDVAFCVETVAGQIGTSNKNVVAEGGTSARILHAMIDTLQKIVDYAGKWEASISHYFTDAPAAPDLDTIVAKFRQSTDVDSAMKWQHALTRLALQLFVSRDNSVKTILYELIAACKEELEMLKMAEASNKQNQDGKDGENDNDDDDDDDDDDENAE